jgi:hypothetical protein
VRALAAGLAFLLLGYQAPPSQGSFEGYYETGFERNAFIPLDRNEQWWVLPANDEIGYQLIAAMAPSRPPQNRVGHARVVVRGELSPPGSHGHLGLYQRELTVTAIVSSDWVDTAPLKRSGDPATEYVGAASMLADRTIRLQLRAGPPGPIGETVQLIKPTDPRYASILDHVGALTPGGASVMVRPWPDR